MSDPDTPFDTFDVVANDEGQHSIWPTPLEVPLGWDPVGVRGTQEECLQYIEEHWVDMRPLSLQRRMDGLPEAIESDGAEAA